MKKREEEKIKNIEKNNIMKRHKKIIVNTYSNEIYSKTEVILNYTNNKDNPIELIVEIPIRTELIFESITAKKKDDNDDDKEKEKETNEENNEEKKNVENNNEVNNTEKVEDNNKLTFKQIEKYRRK